MSYGDILGKMCTEHGCSRHLAPRTIHPYTLVTGTWMAFLDDVTRRTNTRWYHDPVRGKLSW